MASTVAQISFIEDGQSFFCSGALAATGTTARPTFTAGHCVQ